MKTSKFALLYSVLSLLIFSSYSFSASASCNPAPDLSGYSCSGTYQADDMADLNAYLIDYGLSGGVVKNLQINFNMSESDIQVVSPCNIIVKSGNSLSSTSGSVCLHAKGKVKVNGLNAVGGDIELVSEDGNVIVRNGSRVQSSGNANFTAWNKVAIRNGANITIAGDLNLVSTGFMGESKVHIRHSSNVSAANLNLSASERATLGHTSFYNIAGTISLDSQNAFSSFWKNTFINADVVDIRSLTKVKISKNVMINTASKIIGDAPLCVIEGSAVITSPLLQGSCFGVPIDPPPVMVGDQNFNINMNISSGLALSGATSGAGTLTYELVSGPSNGVLSNCLGGTNDLSCDYIPTNGYFGADSFSYKAFDGTQYSVSNSQVDIDVIEDVCLSQQIVFPDAQLDDDVHVAAGVTQGDPLFYADVSVITTLTSTFTDSRTQISDLSGMECLTNMTVLRLAGNSISDISALSDMSAMIFLDIDNNGISDISALAGKPLLTSLLISGNNISDISAVSGMTKLELLELASNNVSDLSPLSGKILLKKLDITSNEVSELSPLISSVDLRDLRASENNIFDISAISEAVEMTQLRLSGNNISDISAVSGMTKLELLELASNNVSDLSPLSGKILLKKLDITSNEVSELSPLISSVDLRDLRASENNIFDISAISEAVEMTQLRLSGNNISDISAVSGMTKLELLELASNNVSDLSPLLPLSANSKLTIFVNGNLYSCPNSTIDTLVVYGINVSNSDCQ